MTLEEKVGQLTQIAGATLPGAKLPEAKPEEALRKGGGGSILWLNDTKKFNELQHIAMEESRLKIPVLYGLDVIHGYRTIFPVPLAMAASWDPSVAERAQAVAAKEARAAGIHWTFGPMLDIARDAALGPHRRRARARIRTSGPPWPRRRCAASRARTLGAPDHVLACAKHFATYGAAEGGRDYDSTYVPEGLHPQRLLPAVPGGGQGRRRVVHERLHGPERRSGRGEPLAAPRRPARRMGLPGVRGQRRVRRREPRDPGLRPRPQGRGPPGARRRPRHGDGQRHLSREPCRRS